MSRRRVAAHIVGVLVVALAVAYVVRPSPHVPPYDANLVRIAETERQGYCSGVAFWRSAGGGSAEGARTCREERRDKSGRVNMPLAALGFCEAIVDEGWSEGTPSDCMTILEGNQLWPTYDGMITDQWNRARPYPSPAVPTGDGSEDHSRTGGRPSVTGRG